MALLAEEDVREVARQLYARHVLAKGDRPLAEADARQLLKVGAARAARLRAPRLTAARRD